ncbi:hypothetical protein [Modicisalibacter luteus]
MASVDRLKTVKASAETGVATLLQNLLATVALGLVQLPHDFEA